MLSFYPFMGAANVSGYCIVKGLWWYNLVMPDTSVKANLIDTWWYLATWNYNINLKGNNHDGRMWNLLTNMMCMYIYISCVFILCQTSLHPNIISPTEISDLSLGKLCLRRRTCQFCAQMNSHVINGPFYEPLVRLRRHMAPNGFNTNKLIKWM